MPTPMIKSLAVKANVSIDKVEQAWFDAKKAADVKMDRKNPQYWGLVTVITKRALGLSEGAGASARSLKKWLSEEESYAEQPEMMGPIMLANTFFWMRDAAHSLHLRTKSYSQHMALGALYEDISELMDQLIEAMQGCCGLFSRITPICPAILEDSPDAVSFVNSIYHWLSGPGKDLLPDDSAIKNLYEELIASFLSAKYKLENLS